MPAPVRGGSRTTTSADGTSGTMTDTSRIAVPAGGQATLQPGGDHVMLTALEQPLEAGTTVDLTFTFSSGTTLEAAFPVLSPEDRPQP